MYANLLNISQKASLNSQLTNRCGFLKFYQGIQAWRKFYLSYNKRNFTSHLTKDMWKCYMLYWKIYNPFYLEKCFIRGEHRLNDLADKWSQLFFVWSQLWNYDATSCHRYWDGFQISTGQKQRQQQHANRGSKNHLTRDPVICEFTKHLTETEKCKKLSQWTNSTEIKLTIGWSMCDKAN